MLGNSWSQGRKWGRRRGTFDGGRSIKYLWVELAAFCPIENTRSKAAIALKGPQGVVKPLASKRSPLYIRYSICTIIPFYEPGTFGNLLSEAEASSRLGSRELREAPPCAGVGVWRTKGWSTGCSWGSPGQKTVGPVNIKGCSEPSQTRQRRHSWARRFRHTN